MRFPDLVKIPNSSSNSDSHSCYKLDWTEFDCFKKNNHIRWISIYVREISKLSKEYRSVYFDEVLDNLDWESYLGVPLKYSKLILYSEKLYLPDSYYNEIIHFKDLAISEWSRHRGFSTNVRETCLGVAESAIDMYFYLLFDAMVTYNKGGEFMSKFVLSKSDITKYRLYRSRECDMIIPLWKYKFWNHQTGGGLVMDKSFNTEKKYRLADINGYVDYSSDGIKCEYMEELRKDIEELKNKQIPGISFFGEPYDIKSMIKKYLRNKSLNDVLK